MLQMHIRRSLLTRSVSRMKNSILTIIAVCALAFSAVSVSARPSGRESGSTQNQQFAITWPWSSRLNDEIKHLNRMRGHVRWLFRNYKSSPNLRRDYFAVSRQIDSINAQYQRAGFDARKLRRDINRARGELQRIESALKVKPRDRYRWK
jgi:tRNA-dihydrouridine synthase